jgi:hypothetical protein
MQTELSGSHRSTYDAMFQHPVARNLHWREVRSMLDAVASVVEEHNGNLKVTRNGQVLLLQRPRKSITEVQEIMDIRRFLERSGDAPAAPAADGTHLLIVIDHREARIYKAELSGSVPQRVVPYDPHGFGRYLHYVQNDSNGQRRPESASFYESVAKTLHGARAILVFGSGTGASSAMEQLLAQLKQHHPDLAGRVIASVAVDEAHLTENQLLAKAREFFAAPHSADSSSK